MNDGLNLFPQSLQAASYPVLDVSRITRLYGERIGCADVNFRLWPGEVLGIVGESGSGKSTLGLLAAEIALAELADRDPTFFKQGVRFVDDGGMFPHQITELAGATDAEAAVAYARAGVPVIGPLPYRAGLDVGFERAIEAMAANSEIRKLTKLLLASARGTR